MNSIKFQDNTKEFNDKLKNIVINWLEEASGEIEAQTKQNSRVDTGKTKGSYTHKVDKDKLEAQIGSPNENAIWEEFGTGIYAENGNGRKDVPWTYRDAKGNFHKTKGKTPNKPLRNAMKQNESAIQEALKDKLKELK